MRVVGRIVDVFSVGMLMIGAALTACAGDTGQLPPPPTEIPAEFASGAEAYASHCASCHGEHARGTETGPPLVHPYYEPSHHGDAAFRFAVERGVAAHHWRFGDMPAQPQVTEAELGGIVPYVRWLQREAGIE